MSFLTSFITSFILFVLGVCLWRLQLGDRRRFEVAEQALLTFAKASEGISRLRRRFISVGELANAKASKNENDDEDADDTIPSPEERREEQHRRLYNVYAARAEAIAPALADLQATRILAEVHLGRAAAEAMDVPFAVRQQVFAAVAALHDGPPFDPDLASSDERRQHREFEESMRRQIGESRGQDGTADKDDALGQKIDAARADLENACRPFLQNPPWLQRVSDLLRKWKLY
jgi:hypothetical protein